MSYHGTAKLLGLTVTRSFADVPENPVVSNEMIFIVLKCSKSEIHFLQFPL